MAIPQFRVSNAHRCENSVSACMLRSVTRGFSVHVGANYPELDLMTRIFHDKGWSNINDFVVAEEEMSIRNDFSHARGVSMEDIPAKDIFVEATMELAAAAAK